MMETQSQDPARRDQAMSTPKTPARFSVLRADVWQPLVRGFDEVVGSDAALGPVRDSVLRPLHLLEAMAANAPAALGDDYFAAERLRSLLYVAAPWRALPAEAAQLAASGPSAQPYEPGVLHHGRLVIVGLAAVRVAPVSAAADLLATVHGLALALSAAEVLGRMGPGAPDVGALETLLRTLVGLGDVPAHPSPNLLRPFARDDVERGRWACLAELFGGKALGTFVRDRLQAEKAEKAEKSGPVLWDGAASDAITAVEPPIAAPGRRIELRGQFAVTAPKRGAGESGRDNDGVQVVFVATADGALSVAEVSRRSKSQVTVTVPLDARSGWIGISDRARVRASNRYRKTVREFWSGLALPAVPARPPTFLACLRQAPVPVAVIPDLGRGDGQLSLPPRTASNRFTIAGDEAIAIADAMVAPAPAPARAAFIAGPPDVVLTATQRGLSAPFVAREGVDIHVDLLTRRGVKFSLVVDTDDGPATVAQPIQPTDTTVDLTIPPTLIAFGTITLTPKLTPADGDDAEQVGAPVAFKVQAAKLLQIDVRQDDGAVPFVAGAPAKVVVQYDASGSDASVEVSVRIKGGDTIGPASDDSGTVTLTIPGDEIVTPQLVFVVELRAKDGSDVLDRSDQITTEVKNPPPVIKRITVAQDPNASPFEAGSPLQVSIEYAPASVKMRVSIVIDGNSIASTTSTKGTATLQIAGALVTVGTLTFDATVTEDDNSDQTVSQTKSVDVIEEMKIVTVKPTQGGLGVPFVSNEPVDVDITYTPAVSGVVQIQLMESSTAPLQATTSAPGHAVIQIPSEFVLPDKLDFQVQLAMPGDKNARDTSRPGPFLVIVPVAVPLVLFRPTILRSSGAVRVSDAERDGAIAGISQRLRLSIAVSELPWVEDPLVVVGSDIISDEDPRIPILFEAMSRAAAFTPGFEAAIWVTMVPSQPTSGTSATLAALPRARVSATPASVKTGNGSNGSGNGSNGSAHASIDGAVGMIAAAASPPRVTTLAAHANGAVTSDAIKLAPVTTIFRAGTILRTDLTAVTGTGSVLLPQPLGFEAHVGTETAVAVVVCDANGLERFLGTLDSLPKARPIVPRLRVVGSFDSDGNVRLEAAREERRAAGPGASKPTGIVVVSLDIDGRPLQRLAVAAERAAEIASFVQLVPVSPEVESVQLRKDGEVVAELRRPDGTPKLSGFGLVAGAATPTLNWKFTHTRAAKPTLQFELVSGQGTFAFTVDPCFDKVAVPVQRLPPNRQLSIQLVATDGWNTAFAPPTELPQVADDLIIRRVIGVQTLDDQQAGTLFRLPGVQWWAESSLPGPFEWSLNGKSIPPVSDADGGRLIQLDPSVRGLLRVAGRDAGGTVALVDTREIG